MKSERRYPTKRLKKEKEGKEEDKHELLRNIFGGLKFVLVVDPNQVLPLKKKITEHGGSVAYIVTKETTHVVTTIEKSKFLPMKLEAALKHGAALISENWIDACLKQRQRVSEKSFMILKSPKFNPTKG